MTTSSEKNLNEHLYSLWTENARWNDDVARQATCKALDIPDTKGMEIKTERNGIGAWGLIGVAAAAGLGPVGMMGLSLLSDMNQSQPTPVVPTPPPIVQPDDSDYEIRFFDSEGSLIEIPQHSPNN